MAKEERDPTLAERMEIDGSTITWSESETPTEKLRREAKERVEVKNANDTDAAGTDQQ